MVGYQTEFSGAFQIGPEPLSSLQGYYLEAFNATRRMTWNAGIMVEAFYPDPLRTKLGIPLGHRGDFFVGHHDWDMDRHWTDPAIEASNTPPGEEVRELFFTRPDGSICEEQPRHFGHGCTPTWMTMKKPYGDQRMIQPGLWCQWKPTPDGKYLEWDLGEKFYHYDTWLSWLAYNLLTPFGKYLDGKVHWRGEDFNDVGTLICTPNLEGDKPRTTITIEYQF